MAVMASSALGDGNNAPSSPPPPASDAFVKHCEKMNPGDELGYQKCLILSTRNTTPNGADSCTKAQDKLRDKAEKLTANCSPAASKIAPNRTIPKAQAAVSSTTIDPSSFDQGRKLATCIDKLTQCSDEEDLMAIEIDTSSPDTSVDDVALSSKCNELGAETAQDLKTEGDQFQVDLIDLQKKVTEAQKAANDAADADESKKIQADLDHQKKLDQLTKDRQSLATDWTAQLAQFDKTLAADNAALQGKFDEADFKEQQALFGLTNAQETHAKTLRDARSKCKEHADLLMARLNVDRQASVQKFENNQGSLGSLTGSLEKFKSHYAEDFNNCMANDYRRVVADANAALRLANKSYDFSVQAVQKAKASFQLQLKTEQAQLSGEKSLEFSRMRNKDAALMNEGTSENNQYQRNGLQMTNAAASRKRNEQAQMSSLDQQTQKLQQKILTNQAQLKKTGIDNPGAATTKGTARRKAHATSGLAELGAYQSAFCDAVYYCPPFPRPPGADQGICAASSVAAESGDLNPKSDSQVPRKPAAANATP